jgi:hypothetical protein
MGREDAAAQRPKLSIVYDPHGLPDQFAPALETFGLGLSRKFLKVKIINTGIAVAENCKATLKAIKWDEKAKPPSKEPKPLLWDSGEKYQDIGAINGEELLHIVLSDSRLAPSNRDEVFALVSTPDTVRMIPSSVIRAQDAIGRGDYDFELTITSKDGHQIKGTFRAHVTENYMDLAMERIS